MAITVENFPNQMPEIDTRITKVLDYALQTCFIFSVNVFSVAGVSGFSTNKSGGNEARNAECTSARVAQRSWSLNDAPMTCLVEAKRHGPLGMINHHATPFVSNTCPGIILGSNQYGVWQHRGYALSQRH